MNAAPAEEEIQLSVYFQDRIIESLPGLSKKAFWFSNKALIS
ncbi:hypothetical protein AB434_0812 [Heyndrickxia coagulans]|nr:hypothetical protein AB434_0812 [Heyndrickxia coagulans]